DQRAPGSAHPWPRHGPGRHQCGTRPCGDSLLVLRDVLAGTADCVNLVLAGSPARLALDHGSGGVDGCVVNRDDVDALAGEPDSEDQGQKVQDRGNHGEPVLRLTLRRDAEENKKAADRSGDLVEVVTCSLRHRHFSFLSRSAISSTTADGSAGSGAGSAATRRAMSASERPMTLPAAATLCTDATRVAARNWPGFSLRSVPGTVHRGFTHTASCTFVRNCEPSKARTVAWIAWPTVR